MDRETHYSIIDTAEQDYAEANKLREILETAAREAGKLRFTHFPVSGMDHEDVAITIRDMLPAEGAKLWACCLIAAEEHAEMMV